MMRPTVIGPVHENKKRISVSRKRQITIPIEFFKAIGIKREVECYMQDDSIIIRPVRESGGEFAEQILADLISRSLSGEELLAEFKKTQGKIRPAVNALLSEAELAAEGKSKYSTYEDVFGSEDV